MSFRNRTGVYRRVLAYLRPYRAQFLGALGCMVIFGASDGVIPFLIKKVQDGIFTQQNSNLLYVLPGLLIGYAVIRAFSDFGQQFLISKVGHLIVRDLRNDLNKHLVKLSPEFFVTQSSGNLLSRITSDVLLIRGLLTDSLSAIIRDSIRVVALLIAAVYLDPLLAAIAFIGFPLGIYPVYRYGRRMRRLSRQGQEAIGALTARLHESMMGNRVVKIFNREQYEQDRFVNLNQDLTNTFVKAERVRAITGPINEVLATFAISLVILYGGFSVIGGNRTQGDFFAFLASVFLLYDPFKKLSRVNSTVQQAMSGAERVFEVLDSKPSIAEPAAPVPLTGRNDVVFENVSFSYGRGDQWALRDISLTVGENMKVALVGFSGSGKSTLVDLVPRFIDPTEGRVLIGGVDVATASLSPLRSRIATVGQHTFLFNDTVFANIAYGNPNATREEILAAAKLAYAIDFIEALPLGFDTIVGEGGFSLSGGERQRIAIARALLKDAPILILDEATASLDNRSEREVQSALEALERDRTTIVIAHRLSTVRNADLIAVMSNGRIVETGTHEELLRRGGEYSRLHELQFREEERTGSSNAA